LELDLHSAYIFMAQDLIGLRDSFIFTLMMNVLAIEV
jgi:hypothetical protein